MTSCEDDFTNLGADFVNSLDLPEPYVVQDLASYSDNIKSVQSNTLSNYLLGEFEDPIFGNSKVSILSQLNLQTTNPDFGVDPQLDSVVLTIPLFGQITGTDEDTGKDIYRLDSIFGQGSFKLGVYESNFFLNSISPGQDGDFNEFQRYYSDQLNEIAPNILFSNPLTISEENDVIVPTQYSEVITPSELNRTVVLVDRTDTIESVNEQGDTIVDFGRIRLSPRIRVKLNPDLFQDKILNQGNSINLVSQSSFINYFRGIYLNTQTVTDSNSKVMISTLLQKPRPDSPLPEANITLYYRSQRPVASTVIVEEPEFEETFNEFSLIFRGNKINFYNHENEINLSGQDFENGEENIFMKGGQGVIAIIDPFNGPDADGNGVADEIDTIRTKNWLINEANLILHVNNDFMSNIPKEKQPFRVFAYDLDRERVISDFNLDPDNAKRNHLGVLTDDDGNLSYKIRITSHINNIINNDSTNTRIGIVITPDVNQARVLDVRDSELDETNSFIESAISTPRGTVIHGNLSADEDKRLKLQIYYTDPNPNN
jgi:hypothetical protein